MFVKRGRRGRRRRLCGPARSRLAPGAQSRRRTRSRARRGVLASARAARSLEDLLERVPGLGEGLVAEVGALLRLLARRVLDALGDLLLGADGVGADVAGVGEDGGALEGAREDAVEEQAEAGADLDEGRLAALGLGDLVVADPDAAVEEVEGEGVVDEGLAAAVAAGGAEDLHEHLLEQQEVRLGLEGGVEYEEGAGSEQMVPGEFQLAHGVNILN